MPITSCHAHVQRILVGEGHHPKSKLCEHARGLHTGTWSIVGAAHTVVPVPGTSAGLLWPS